MKYKKVAKLPYEELLKYWGYIELVDHELKYLDRDAPKHSNKHIPLKAEDDVACIFETDEETIISFNGSSTVKEWFGNFRFSPHGGFHRNFHKIAEMFYKQILEHVTDINRPIKVVGHSRGGLCQIVGYLMIKFGFKNVVAVTFGSPRVATRRGVKKLARRGLIHHRVEAGLDIVDNLPFNWMFYKHYQNAHYKLKTVRGKLDHLAFRKALEKECE